MLPTSKGSLILTRFHWPFVCLPNNLTTLSEADNSARVKILKRMYYWPPRPFESGVPKMGGRNYNLGTKLKSPQGDSLENMPSKDWLKMGVFTS